MMKKREVSLTSASSSALWRLMVIMTTTTVYVSVVITNIQQHVVQAAKTDGVGVAIGGMSEHYRFIDILNSKANNSNEKGLETAIELEEEDDESDDESDDDDDDDVQLGWIEQRLDHFRNPSAVTKPHTTFRQRYFYSDRYVVAADDDKKTKQYAFLCVGGEGPALTKAVLIDSVHCTGDMLELAKILHREKGYSIHLFALEHRYYGESYPEFVDYDVENNNNQQKNKQQRKTEISPVTNENLVYLSSRQALEDLAHFVRNKTATTTQTSTATAATTTWITFGGSYPGMLAGWARYKYPHLIHAAVSNSAPIYTKLDMQEYNERVAWDLQYTEVGGSKECLHTVQEGHQQLMDMLHQKTPDTKYQHNKHRILELFNFCDANALDHIENVRSWLGDGVVYIPAQSNDPACGSGGTGGEGEENYDDDNDLCNIKKICDYITTSPSTKPSWETLADLSREQRRRQQRQKQQRHHKKGIDNSIVDHGDHKDVDDDDDCLIVDWNQTLDYIKDPSRGKADGGLRSWLWQTCTEFGFYQTCEETSSCPYGKGDHDLQEDYQICQYAFGIPADQVRENIQQTQEHYGSDTKLLSGGSRILSVNGNVDPWATLARDNATPNSNDPLLPTYEVEGASHHFWTHAVQDTDTPFVKKARSLIYQTITQWLVDDADDDSAAEPPTAAEKEANLEEAAAIIETKII